MRWWWGGLVGLLSGFMVSQTLSLVAQWAADAGLCAACCPGSTVEGAATCGWHRLYDDSRLAWVAGWMKLLAVEAQSTSLQLFQDLRSWIYRTNMCKYNMVVGEHAATSTFPDI